MILPKQQTDVSRTDREDIAIVGMACIFPGAGNVAQYWHNIVNKVDCVTDPPPDWQPELFLDAPGRNDGHVYVGKGGYLGDLCRFSPAKYGVMPNSVEGAEPDQFLALRCAFEAFADAGIPELPINQEKTGVILGRGTFVNRGFVTLLEHGFVVDQVLNVIRQLDPNRSEEDLEQIRAEIKRNLPPSTAETAPGLAHSVLAGRIANRMDLNGPAYTVDAACASSLLAVEHAIQELRSGRCDAVLAGGVQVSTPGLIHILFCQLEALSRSGDIAPFSAGANGTLLGEGCGMLVLKRRADAERDGNRIYALIKAVGIASDGKGGGLLAPRQEGQVLSIRRAYEQADLDPFSVGLIEAHGTGIPLGDITEMASLTECFGPRTGKKPTIALGSVKSMISHLIPAAGAASLIKTALALYHRTLPPTLHAENPNPDLGLDKTPFYLNTETKPWVHGDLSALRRAGINAFGFGGINGHAILEEHSDADEPVSTDLDRCWPVELVVVSARDRSALRQRAEALADWIERAEDVSLLDVAASCAADLQPCKVALCAKTLDDLVKKLRHVAKLLADGQRKKIQDRSGIFYYDDPLALQGRVAFVFPGEGAQYVNMLDDLCRHFPEVRRQFDLTDEALAFRGPDRALSRLIFPPTDEAGQAEQDLFEMEGALEAVASANRALLALLTQLGVTCDAVVGHSSGEFIALVAAGIIDVADEDELVRCIAQGGRVTEKILRSNRLSSARLTTVGGIDVDVTEQVVAESAGELVVAMDNCPHQLVLVGGEHATDTALKKLQNKGGVCQKLPWDRPYHTDAYAPICDILEEYYSSLRFQTAGIEAWSCSTADRYPAKPDAIRELAVRQWRTPVRFRETILAMHDAGVRVFVEVGPRGNLSAFISDTLADRPHVAVPMNVLRKSGLEQLCRAVGMLAAHGVTLDLGALYRRRSPRRLDFSADPPAAPKPDPILRLDLPELKIDEDAAQSLLAKTTRTALPSAPPVPTQQAHPAATSQPAPATSAANPRARAFADYQETMRKFLETQQRVMTSFFGFGSASSATSQPMLAPEATPPPAPTVEPCPSEPPPAAPLISTTETTPTEPVEHAAPKAVAATETPLADRLIEIVSDRTGYPPEMLDLDANLEADLGIDSIKRVEIIGTFRRTVLPDMNDPPAAYMEKMTAATSLRAIIEAMRELIEPAAAHAEEDSEPATAAGAAPPRFPFIEHVLVHEAGVRLVAECELDVRKHPFLLDHTFGQTVSVTDPALAALPLMPLAMTLELMAEAACTLHPNMRVAAITDVKTLRWLAFDTPTRRIRIEVSSEDDASAHVAVYEADREGMQAAIAEARIELSIAEPDLGPPTIQRKTTASSRWKPEELYTTGLFHGPAFRAVRSIDGWDAVAVRATLQQPDPGLMLQNGDADRFILPVSLIDGAGQIVGFWGAQHELKMGFPTGLGRLEFSSTRSGNAALHAVGAIDQPQSNLWRSDVEVTTDAGQVVLRITRRTDQVIDVPDHFWRYRTFPRDIVFSRQINEVHQISEVQKSVPEATHLAVCELGDFRRHILTEASGFWALVLSRLTLDRAERKTFAELKCPPPAVASWLLGRIVAKDAVRLLRSMDVCMADVGIRSDENGRPIVDVDLPPDQMPLVSLAHADGQAVAVAVGRDHFDGVGIDIEPIRPLDANVLADAFTDQERNRIEAAARRSGESVDAWYVSAWGAKEAVGKALGRGVLGGPRNVEIVDIDPTTGRLSTTLVGPMAELPGARKRSRIASSTIDAYRRIHRRCVITLCLLAKSEN